MEGFFFGGTKEKEIFICGFTCDVIKNDRKIDKFQSAGVTQCPALILYLHASRPSRTSFWARKTPVRLCFCRFFWQTTSWHKIWVISEQNKWRHKYLADIKSRLSVTIQKFGLQENWSVASVNWVSWRTHQLEMQVLFTLRYCESLQTTIAYLGWMSFSLYST